MNNPSPDLAPGFNQNFCWRYMSFLPQQDTREEKEFKVSHLARAVLLDPEENDMSKVIKMIHQKGNELRVHLALWPVNKSTAVFFDLYSYRP